MLDPPVVTVIILATLAFYNTLCNSREKFVYCPPGLKVSESSDGDIIYGSWRNDTPEQSMYPIQCRGRGHKYSVSAKAVRDTYSEYYFNEGTFPWHLELV